MNVAASTTTADAPAIPAAVGAYLTRKGLGGTAAVTPLTPDASDRRYFRIATGAGDPFVLAVLAAPFVTDTLPFTNVAALLSAMSVHVPRVLDQAGDLGVLALEDLGDVTLHGRLTSATDAERLAFYREAVDIIRTLQRRGAELASPSFVPYSLAFDEEKLMWEIDFFITHFLGGLRQRSLPASEQTALRRELHVVVAELAAEPRVLCHRDFHSRNLMVRNEHLRVIDFQDARMGPTTYDLASLLRDSYVSLPAVLVDQLIGEFALSSVGDRASSEFRRRFDLMALQRNLKALGTFGFQASVRGNTAYLGDVPRTLGYVRDNLARRDHGALRDLLSRHIEELR